MCGLSRETSGNQLKRLLEWSEERRKLDEMAQEWAEKYRPTLGVTIETIRDIQNFSASRKEILLIVLTLGFAVNVASNAAFDIILGSSFMSVYAALFIGFLVAVIIWYAYKWFNPRPIIPAQLNAYLSLDELMNYLDRHQAGRIRKFMNDKEGITDFSSFAKSFLTLLASLSDIMFGVKETSREISVDETKVDSNFPPWKLTLKLPDFMLQCGIEPAVRFRILPHIYEVQGERAVRRLNFVFSLQILNPQHPYSELFLRSFHELRMSLIPGTMSFALNSAFHRVIEASQQSGRKRG